jgi:hypothetical protein
MANSNELEKAHFLFELYSSSYDRVDESIKTLDQKIHSSLSLSVTLITLFVGILYYILSSQNPISTYRNLYVTAFALGIFMLFFVVILGVFAYRPRPTLSLGTDEFQSQYVKEDYLTLVKLAVVNIADMEKKNRHVVESKAKYYLSMLIFLMLGVFFFVIGFGLLASLYLAPLR